jgi:predicted DNA-binding transcriptional regulator YafY
MQASRLLSILMLLQSRGRLTATELAQEMEVSPRTILRDVDQLSAAGVPLWGTRGRQGGFQLRAGWSTTLTGMTEPEANALLLAGLPGAATELGLGAAAASARLKLVASLPVEWRAQAVRIGQQLHFDPVDWYRAADTPRHLRDVAQAVWQGRRLRIHYESWSGTAWREIEPLGLVLKGGAWYVMARPAGNAEVRTFRLASIRAAQASDATFRRPRRFDLAQAWRASVQRFESGLRTFEAHLRISPRAAAWLANARVPCKEAPVITLANIAPKDTAHTSSNDRREVRVRFESIEQGAREVLGWGDEVEVVEPAALRDEIRRLLEALVLRYKKDSEKPLAPATASRPRPSPPGRARRPGPSRNR